MAGPTQEIQAYEARMRWGSVLDSVHAGTTYIVSKRRQAVAAIVPLEQWQREEGGTSAAAAELAALVDQLNTQNAETSARLDRAFAALAQTRRALDEWRREHETQGGAARGSA